MTGVAGQTGDQAFPDPATYGLGRLVGTLIDPGL